MMNHDAVRELAPGFVLGALTPNEEQRVREHLATCGEPHPEFEVFGGVVHYLDETVELIEPPASLKQRVLAAVAAEPQVRESGAAAERARAPMVARSSDVLPVTVPRPAERARPAERDAARRGSPWRWLVGIAAVVAIVGLAGWNVLLQMQLGSASSFETSVAAVLDVAARPGSQTAILSGDGGRGPRGIAAVAADGSVALAMRDLEPTSGAGVYEAWLIAAGAGPVPIGSFTVAGNGTASLTARATPASGATIALTREPGPGATTPTLPIVSKGVATAPPS
jgi:hypothetical protein